MTKTESKSGAPVLPTVKAKLLDGKKGLVVGIAVSLGATRMLRSQLFGVQPADPLSYAAVAVLLSLVALAACYIPARRAAAVDPIVALRD